MSEMRDAFEKWAKGQYSIGFRYEDSQLLNHVDGEYERSEVDNAWLGWKACAAQLAAPVLTECRHCGFRVALNEAPQGAVE